MATALPLEDSEQCLINTYCNDYMGYVTTFEEYQEQAYEGGHTVYGQWTLGAFQTAFTRLAATFNTPPSEREPAEKNAPPPVPDSELALRSDIPVRG